MMTGLTGLARHIRAVQTSLRLPMCRRAEIAGVYLLLDDEGVVYVGKSFDIEKRVRQHERQISFRRAFCIATKPKEMDAYEGVLIRLFRPRHNVYVPREHLRDAFVIERLGVRERMP